ncbi:MAG: hypothetical protein JSV25_03490 [Spirochaetota bacterium]|nr:MAG: hypothetical protein JSV25_03490 [Spirochaetota bacterium]
MYVTSKIKLFLLCFLVTNHTIAGQGNFPAINGNHLIKGSIDLEHTRQIKLEFYTHPTWIVGYEHDGLSVWYILLSDSTIQKVTISKLSDTDVTQVDFTLPANSILTLDKVTLFSLVNPEQYRKNFLTHPVRVTGTDTVAAISESGQLVVQRLEDVYKLDIDPLIDSRLVKNNSQQILLLTGNSKIYQHGILGDKIEPTGYAIIDTYHREPYIKHRFSLNDGSVFETLMPIWTDINNDKKDEVILTRSDAKSGVGLQVYDEAGKLLSSGESIGIGFRWMHLLAAALFGSNGEFEITAVRTPHIGGILEFYRLAGKTLKVVHRRNGYSTHRIGSRNLDTALAGDFNNDHNIEILIPTQNFRRIDSIKRTESGSKIDYSIALDDQLSTNIAAYSFQGRINLAFGTYSGDVIIFRQ